MHSDDSMTNLRRPELSHASSVPAGHTEVHPPSYRASVPTNTSLDMVQRFEHKLAQYNASQSILRRWLLEILSVAISALCMGAMVAILLILKDHPLEKWPTGLTVIAVISKVASATLLMPISEALGQLKWSWFHGKNSRNIVDFEVFDQASRGAWGSLLLLCRTKGRSLAALGAILTLLLLAIDTFFQQLTDLPTRSTLHGSGLIPRTVRYKPHYSMEFASGFEASQMDQNILAVANTFFVGNGTQPVPFGNGTRPEIPLSCPTSNCTWPSYETLGICSQCADVSNLLLYTCLDTRIDWTSTLNSTISSYPNATTCGYFLNATTENPIMMSGYALGSTGEPEGEILVMRTLPLITNPLRELLWGGSINFKAFRNPIFNVVISSTSNKSHVLANTAPTLNECVLTWCVKTIKSSYSSGTYQETIINTYNNLTAGKTPWSTFTYEDYSTDQTYLENITIHTPFASSTSPAYDWGVSNITMVLTTLVFDRIFPALTTVTEEYPDGLLRWRLGHVTEVRTRILEMNPWLLPNNITQHMERLATALTNVVRSDPSSNELLAGNAFVTETYVAVHWAWLTFPLVMLSLSVIFLIATVVKTSDDQHTDVGTWKTSAMPTLLYSLPESIRHEAGTTENGLKKVRIRLIPNQGWRVSRRVRPTTNLPRQDVPHPYPEWI